MQRLPTSEEDADEAGVFNIDNTDDADSFDNLTDQAIENIGDEPYTSYDDDDDDNDSRGSHDSVDGREDAVEMGNLSRNQKRRMKSMGIMLGDDFLEEQRDGTCCNSNNNKYWYVWLCCTIAVVCAILATDGALQYRKEAALLHGYGENGDDYNAEECRVYDQQTLGIVEQHLAHANDTATFCQADKLNECHCKHPFHAAKPDDFRTQWAEISTMNDAMVETFTKHIKPDVALIGDSITQHWNGMDLGPDKQWRSIKPVFDKLFKKHNGGKVNGVALGIGGDRIQNLLFRLQNGEAPRTFHPKVWWILIGTNDLEDKCNADTIVAGNFRIVDEIRRFHPGAKIVLNSMLPRNENPDNLLESPTWPIIQEINLKLECYANTARGVDFFNATDVFVAHRKGKTVVNSQFMKDSVHPNAEGSRLWGEAIVDRVLELQNRKNSDNKRHGGKKHGNYD